MLEREDYMEPRCPLCMNTKERIPVDRIIKKLDEHLEKGETDRAEEHLRYWLSESKNLGDNSGELTVSSELMGFLRKNGRKEEALTLAYETISSVSRFDMDDSIVGATALLNAGTVFRAFGHEEEAATQYKRAEAVYQKDLLEDDVRVAGLYNNFAATLAELKRYDEALDKYNKALDILSKKQSSELEEAITYLNIADLINKRDGLENAESKTEELLGKAYTCLTLDKTEHNAYYRFVLYKCIPAFDYYGHIAESMELRKRMNE